MEWKQVHTFGVPKRDTRDPHLLVFKKRLFVYTGTWYSGDAPARNSDLELNQHLGYAVWTLPALLFAPGLMGRLPHESGLALMVAATVNLHHFLLDGAVWKLRDGRVSRILLGTAGSTPEAEEAPRRPIAKPRRSLSPWLQRLAYGLGALCLAYGAITYSLDDLGFGSAMARGDLPAAQKAADRLRWFGRDGPGRRTELGRRYAREGRIAAHNFDLGDVKILALVEPSAKPRVVGVFIKQDGNPTRLHPLDAQLLDNRTRFNASRRYRMPFRTV